MSTQLKLRRGTTAQHSTFTGAEGEVTVDTTKDTLVVHDGTTAGGVPLSKAADTVNLTGAQTIAGVKTFSSDAIIQGLTVGRGAGAVSTNTAVGASALAANTSGFQNTAGGANALAVNTTGVASTAFGYNALALSTGDANNAFGRLAMPATTTGTNNAAFGNNTLQANTTGSYNVALGANALNANTTASSNTAVGYQAVYSNTAGGSNTAVGRQALYSNTTADENTAVGYQALYSNTTGNANIAIGHQTGYANTTGANNAYFGYQAGGSVTTGVDNTLIGHKAGQYSNAITTGNDNVIVGAYSNTAAATNSGAIVIGRFITGKGTNTGIIAPGGGGGVYQGNNSLYWSQTSDRRLKKNIVDNTDGLNKITAVRVRNFEYRLPEEVTELDPSCVVPNAGVQLGVIAQELQEVLPECIKTESTGVMTVNASNLTWYMINAIQELKAEVDSLKAQINGASA